MSIQDHLSEIWLTSGTTVYAMDKAIVCEMSEPLRGDNLVIHEKLRINSPSWREAFSRMKLICAAPEAISLLKDLLESGQLPLEAASTVESFLATIFE